MTTMRAGLFLVLLLGPACEIAKAAPAPFPPPDRARTSEAKFVAELRKVGVEVRQIVRSPRPGCWIIVVSAEVPVVTGNRVGVQTIMRSHEIEAPDARFALRAVLDWEKHSRSRGQPGR